VTSARKKKGLDLSSEMGVNWELDASQEMNRKYILRQAQLAVKEIGPEEYKDSRSEKIGSDQLSECQTRSKANPRR
jgi:hypothetical protein